MIGRVLRITYIVVRGIPEIIRLIVLCLWEGRIVIISELRRIPSIIELVVITLNVCMVAMGTLRGGGGGKEEGPARTLYSFGD